MGLGLVVFVHRAEFKFGVGYHPSMKDMHGSCEILETGCWAMPYSDKVRDQYDTISRGGGGFGR